MVRGKEHMKKIMKAARKGDNEEKKAWHAALRSFNGFATAGIGPSVIEADYIFIHCCVGNVHWVLFMFAMKGFDGLVLDPLNDEPDYEEDIKVVTWLLPRLFTKLHPQHGRDPAAAEILALPYRPKQRNCNDCGVL